MPFFKLKKCRSNMKKIHEKIFTNAKYKITVILLAISVWFFVKIDDNYRYSFWIPLKIANLGESRIVVNDIPKRVKVTFWGKGRLLLSLMLRKDATYILDVSSEDDSVEVVLDKDDVRMLKRTNVEILNIDRPDKLVLVIKELKRKKVEVISQVNMETVPGYTIVGDIYVNPDSITIRGPKPYIDSISSVYTVEKTVADIKKDVNKKVKLLPLKQPFLTMEVQQVELKANVQKLMEKPLSDIPVKVLNAPENADVIVIPSTLSLILEGGTDVLLNIHQDDIQAYIDYEKIKTAHQKYHPAYINTPDDVRYRNSKPMRFKIVIERKK